MLEQDHLLMVHSVSQQMVALLAGAMVELIRELILLKTEHVEHKFTLQRQEEFTMLEIHQMYMVHIWLLLFIILTDAQPSHNTLMFSQTSLLVLDRMLILIQQSLTWEQQVTPQDVTYIWKHHGIKVGDITQVIVNI